MSKPLFYCYWQRDIALTLIAEFHFGVDDEEHPKKPHWFSGVTDGDVIRLTKNVHTIPQIMGLHRMIVPDDAYARLRPLIISKYRRVEFSRVFRTAWSFDGPDLYHEYLRLQEKRCLLEGIPEHKWEFAFGHEPEDAYRHYLHRDSCEQLANVKAVELIVQSASWVSHNEAVENQLPLNRDLLILKDSPFCRHDDMRQATDCPTKLGFRRYSPELVKPTHSLQTFISPMALNEHGLLSIGGCAYFCTESVFDAIHQYLDLLFWEWQAVDNTSIKS
ncbi:MAG: hypothetical protein ACK6DS_03025 [Planctomycetota bacterium]